MVVYTTKMHIVRVIVVPWLLNGYGYISSEGEARGRTSLTQGWYKPYPLRSHAQLACISNTDCEASANGGLHCCLATIVVPYETTRITNAATRCTKSRYVQTQLIRRKLRVYPKFGF